MTDESPTEFVADVDGIGQFVFAKRTMRLEIRAAVEMRRLTEGVQMDEFTMTVLSAIADLKVLTQVAPDGWRPEQLDELDPFDDDTYARIMQVWGALREKERPFRRSGAGLQAGGQSAGGNA